MAKTSERRFHTIRLQRKWERLLRAVDPKRDLQCITFGKVFSRDPFDCGNPQCPLCSFEKVFYPKSQRKQTRKEEKQALLELNGLYENDPD